jgi:hypothetical protein
LLIASSTSIAHAAFPFLGIPEPHYPFHDRTVIVTICGRVCLYRKKINLSKFLAGQVFGVKEVDNGRIN